MKNKLLLCALVTTLNSTLCAADKLKAASSTAANQSDADSLEKRQAAWDKRVADYKNYMHAARAAKKKPLLCEDLDFGPRPTE